MTPTNSLQVAPTVMPKDALTDYDPYGQNAFTPVQKATEAGAALKALAASSGLNLLGSSSGSASSSGSGGGSGYGTVAMPDTSAAMDATFARAKDQTGQNTRASLTALENELGASHMLGSGLEAGAKSNLIAKGGNGLNEVTREQAIQDALAKQRQAQMTYQGNITQRGQDINVAQQEATRNQQVMQGLLSAINSSGMLY